MALLDDTEDMTAFHKPPQRQDTVQELEPLSWSTQITDMFTEFGQHIAKVNVEESDRLCKVLQMFSKLVKMSPLSELMWI